jgi:hypothetical protein
MPRWTLRFPAPASVLGLHAALARHDLHMLLLFQ